MKRSVVALWEHGAAQFGCDFASRLAVLIGMAGRWGSGEPWHEDTSSQAGRCCCLHRAVCVSEEVDVVDCVESQPPLP